MQAGSEDLTPSFPFVTDIAFQRGDVVFATDKRGRLVYWNNEAEQLFGYSADELLGSPFEVICTAAPGGSGVDLPAILSGSDFAGGMRCSDKSGREVALYMYATAGRDQSVTAVGVVFVARDVTPFWSAEQAVRTAEDKYRLLFDHSLDAVAIADVEGRVLEANPACLRLYGYTADELRQVNSADLVAPEHRAEAAEAIAGLAAGKTATKTIKMLRKNGTQFVADLVASVASVQGERRVLAVTRDVTERARAEQAMRESERKYRLVFESAGDAVFIESIDGRILDANKNACGLLGYSKEELLKKTVSDLVPAASRAWLSHVTDALLRGGTFRAEAVNVHKSGRQIPVETNTSTMELDGRTAVLAIVRDVTKRTMAQRALRESEERYQQIVNSDAIGVVTADPSFRFTCANSRFCEMLGYTEEELKKLSFVDVTHPENAERDRAAVAEMFAGKRKYYATEKRYVRRDGGEVVARTTVFPISDDVGRPRYTLAMVEDITERTLAERALGDSEGRFRGLLESSPDGVAVHQDGKVVLMNPAGARILGYDGPAAVTGMPVRELLHPDETAAVLDRMRRVAQSGPAEARFRRRDKGYALVEVASARIEWKGRPAVQVVFRDASERKAAEKRLQESEDRLRRLVEMSPDGIAAECDGAIAYANRRFAVLHGYDDAGQVTGRPIADFVAPGDRGRIAEYSEARARGEPAPTRYRFQGLRRDGAVVEFEISVSTYSLAGKLYLLGFLREVEVRSRRPAGGGSEKEKPRAT